jgi:hypothetical protein
MSLTWGYSKPVIACILIALAICVCTSHTYAQVSKNIDPAQDDPQPCFPPDQYTPRPGDPPFGAHVQTTAKVNNKEYLLGIEYCEDGTFEFVGSSPGAISLTGIIYQTGQWWWDGSKSCTQLDANDTDQETPPIECKEAGHWLGEHKISVLTSVAPVRKKRSHSAQTRSVRATN